jgi:putative ABC transport system ATP-binding protein
VGAEPVIRTVGLEKTYQAGDVAVRAVRGVSLSVARGEFAAIMGASGSGKSTLMNLIGCLDRPTAGAYWLDGEEVGALSKNALSRVRNQRLGFVFQGFNLLARTSALEDVELPLLYSPHGHGRRELQRRARAALAQVGLADREGHPPSRLSGGQQQRVAIARALVNEPAVLLADEPTGNLDTRTSLDIMAIFQALNRAGMTILMVTHEPDVARYCGREIAMRDGVVISDRAVGERRDAAADLAAWGDGTSPGGGA